MARQLSLEQTIEALATASPLEKQKLRADLIQAGSAAMPGLVRAVESNENPKCSHAAEILVAIDPQAALPTLIAALQSTNINLRQKAIELLGNIGNPEAVPILLNHLNQERPILQLWVVQSLGKLKDARAVDTLIGLLQVEGFPSLRYMAVEALGRIGDLRALPLIKPLWDDPDHHVRERVASALKALGESV